MSQSLYQKYRPRKFEEVIGQDSMIRVLKNSIKTANIQNAYIFNGPRGTGKTSLAKIFSYAINCESLDEPLNDNCNVCQYFSNTKDSEDIYELDAASNNGVAEIRKIIDNCWFSPVKLKKKIYIIDEVHMLSKGAFNALLKTLEEPPEHVVFILATTEVNKIPVTILSRCQRFDLNRVTEIELNKHLENILNLEKIKFEKESLNYISELSDGCVRDALSLLQKVISSGEEITSQSIRENLNINSNDVFLKITNLIIEKKTSELLKYWETLYLQGINETNFIIQFQTYLKNEIITNIENHNLIYVDILLKLNDIEQRAVYTTQLKNIIMVALIELTTKKLEIDKTISIKNTPEKRMNTVQIEPPKEKIQKDIKIENSKIINNTKQVDIEQNSNANNNLIPNSELNNKILQVLDKADKNFRIDVMKKFLKLSDTLNEDKKFGLAKFFSEGNIRAASEDSLIVTISKDYIDDFYERIDELNLLLSNKFEIIIIDNDTWSNILKLYLQKNKFQKTKKDIKDEQVVENTENKLINTIEKKLNKKIQILEE